MFSISLHEVRNDTKPYGVRKVLQSVIERYNVTCSRKTQLYEIPVLS